MFHSVGTSHRQSAGNAEEFPKGLRPKWRSLAVNDPWQWRRWAGFGVQHSRVCGSLADHMEGVQAIVQNL